MTRALSLEGQKFGRLTVLNKAPSVSNKSMWHCLCDCGNECVVVGYLLKNGTTHSCGCLAREIRSERASLLNKGRKSPRFLDLTGKRFGVLTVIDRAENGKSGATRWNCVCDCGNKSVVVTSKLTTGKTISCGCLGLKHATEAKIKHGMAGTKLYRLYKGMMNRCYLKSSKGYRWYGEKGISVCQEWHDFNNFLEWSNKTGYKEGLTIDRIDSTKGYSPNNCEWVTRSENSRRMHEYYRKLKE